MFIYFNKYSLSWNFNVNNKLIPRFDSFFKGKSKCLIGGFVSGGLVGGGVGGGVLLGVTRVRNISDVTGLKEYNIHTIKLGFKIKGNKCH